MWQAFGNMLGADLSRLLLGLVIILAFSQLNALFLVWLVRKVAGHIQLRPGPKEVGPFGLLQTIVDGIKLVGNGGPATTCGLMTLEFRRGNEKYLQGRLKSEPGGGAPMWLDAPK